MRQAGIPLEVMWNDIDWMKRYRQFQFDVNYPIEEFGKFVDDLHEAGQYYVSAEQPNFGKRLKSQFRFQSSMRVSVSVPSFQRHRPLPLTSTLPSYSVQ